jgi:hypothetical protein
MPFASLQLLAASETVSGEAKTRGDINIKSLKKANGWAR